MNLIAPKITPPLDPDFRPASLANRAYRRAVAESGAGVPLKIALERASGAVSVYETTVFEPSHPRASENLQYVERLVKFLLWQRGGWKVTIGGPKQVADHIAEVYSEKGKRSFDYTFMGGVYEQTFTVVGTSVDEVPAAKEAGISIGRHLEGCRIGFDAGASDIKFAAVVDGKPIFTDELAWDPRGTTDPHYHIEHIDLAFSKAAEHMPRVDAIGCSSAGIYVDNKTMVASLFRSIPEPQFSEFIKPIYINLGKKWGVPLEVANDGDVTALAGAMSLGTNRILGIAMGSSEAVGYVDANGAITGWLNELAFAPVDYREMGPEDEWSGDRGVGAMYFSQQAAIRMAPAAGITLKEGGMPGDKLEEIQKLLNQGNEGAHKIFESIGVFLGYGIAHYADFYDLANVLILGRVTSFAGGEIILEQANAVIREEFPDLTGISVSLPDEKSKRVGQAVAAASLPSLN